ncbi:guanitoxin biosynthesis MBL fold metallo-hydrolase GntH [Microbulbifer agarilyticus]|uniref:guanitoxin biosynthesis MBL fold metallo-hydrolase GntH n=1 Tax=Microbulbifer agarilyticus TaxID=260552 RepID=UPI001CD47CE8|nr:guanitoxin biosynthesis MBL fold metallo-hydrolase GntH [Microbulbifer agarilyticus]MCA0900660.1 MBL fold metallo-hydrolase [Microbulbifer agarilyticus]
MADGRLPWKQVYCVCLLSISVIAFWVAITAELISNAHAQEARGQLKSDDPPATPPGRIASPVRGNTYPASYFPNTELLNADEMRITALGTGMPNQTRAAVSISYLVELGNGDSFLFDIGSGSMANLFSLRPDFSRLDKVFASHLHIDHVGDFMGLHIGGWLSGRYTPMHFYGPSGSTPELGSKAFVDAMQKGYAWDLATRTGALPDKGAKIVVHEFDYMQENAVVYEKNGVTVRSWPAIHSLDGSVSYSLEWNGLKYVFGGDTYPNNWYIRYAKDADVASHECFLPPDELAKYFGWDLKQATYVATRIHTSPDAFGKVMSAITPRLAVGYHSVQSPENNAAIMDGVRATYSGPLALARDLMVINVTKNDITVRMATVDEYVLPPAVSEAYKNAPRTEEKSPSEKVEAGKWQGYTPPPMPE